MSFRPRGRSAVLAVALACAACRPSPPGARSALLVTLDTTRADVVGCLGGPPGITPTLDALASESVRYACARTTAPLTLPAHTSMMTGLYPIRHSARDNSLWPVPQAALTLAERAREHGFQTAAFVASAVLDPEQGLAQGFEVYDAVPRRDQARLSAHFAERKAGAMLRVAREWFQSRDRERPFFCWVHFFDPHFPHEAPPAYVQRAGGDPYRGEVAFADQALGELLALLRADGTLDQTLVIVCGDHGEGLGDHGERSHAVLCYDSTLRVPLFVRWPDGYRAGELSRETVSVADVYPTAVAALGLGQAGDVDGLDLRQRVPPDRGVYFESFYPWLQFGWSPIAGWANARGKYLHSSAPELYDTAADPGESDNLLARGQVDPAPWRQAIERVAERPALEPDGRVDVALLAELAKLGYATGGGALSELPHPLEPTGRPSAVTRMDELHATYRAIAEGERGNFAAAIELLQPIVRQNPRNVSAQERLAGYLLAESRYAEAEEVLTQVLELGYETATNQNNLAYALLNQDRLEEALLHARRAYELDPGHPSVPLNLAVILRRLGRDGEAAEWEARAREEGLLKGSPGGGR